MAGLSDAEVFGSPPASTPAPGTMSDDEVFGTPRWATPTGGEFGDLSAQPWAQGEPVDPAKIAPSAKLASVAGIREALAPEPGYVPTGILPLSLKETTPGSGVADPNSGLAGMHWDWGPIRGSLIRCSIFWKMPGLATSVGGENAPLAGKVSPEATAFLLGSKMGNPASQIRDPLQAAAEGGDIRFGAPEAQPPSTGVLGIGGDLRAAPLPPEFTANPMTPEGKEAVRAVTQPPTPPSPETVPATPVTRAAPLMDHFNQQETPPAPAPTPAPSTPTGIPIVTPETPTPTPTPTMTADTPSDLGPLPGKSAYAKQVASAYYDIADKAGGTLTPQFTNNFIDSVASVGKQTEAGQVVAGPNAVSGLVDRLQTLKDQPMTLGAAQEVDEALGDLIDKEFGVKGLSKDGRKLAQIQSTFRYQIENEGTLDLTGGTTGFDALGPARKAWSQAMKMDDLERIQQRADLTDNPATSIKTQIRTLLTNRTKSRGYSPDEIAALKSAADRGVVGSALHVFGSRLLPLAAGAVGLSHGPVSAAIHAAIAQPVANVLRAGATGIANRRLNRAMGTLGEGVPPNPLLRPFVPGQFIPPPYRNQMAPR